MLHKNIVWKLPPKPVDGKWKPVVRLGNWIPFGYKEDPNDPDILLPIVEELEALEKAKELRKEYSLREVANWLSKVTGKQISHEGLRKRLKREHKRRQAYRNYKFYAQRAEEAARKAKKIEESYGIGEWSDAEWEYRKPTDERADESTD